MTILRAVMQKLSLKKNTAPADQRSPNAADLNSSYAALVQLQESRQLLEVIPAGATRSYQSMIVAIDAERHLVWLDDLFPNQHILETGDEITVRHHRNGEVLTFTTPVIAWGSSFGASGLAVILPEEAEYKPRRATPRCDLSNHTPISAKIRLLGQEACFGTVKDISYAGLCVMVPGNLLGQLHQGAIMPACEVHLGKELYLHCRARIKSFRLCREPYRATRISIEFIDLAPRRSAQLQQFVDRLTHPEHLALHAA